MKGLTIKLKVRERVQGKYSTCMCMIESTYMPIINSLASFSFSQTLISCLKVYVHYHTLIVLSFSFSPSLISIQTLCHQPPINEPYMYVFILFLYSIYMYSLPKFFSMYMYMYSVLLYFHSISLHSFYIRLLNQFITVSDCD